MTSAGKRPASGTPRPPRVSVILPVYNAERFLEQALDSILGQTFADFELIAVDDGSTDRSPDLLAAAARRDPRMRVLRNRENLRISRTLNRGLEAARGDYAVRMDADDVAAPDRLAKQVAYMDAHPEVGVSGGTMVLIDAEGKPVGRRTYHLTDADIRRRLFRYSPFSHPTVVFRRSVLAACGGYDPAYDFAEDYELYFRIGRRAAFGNLPDVLLYYRVLPGSITASRTRIMETKTLAIRAKAVRDYGYRMTWADRIYTRMQWLSVYLMPAGLKIRLFNWLASRR